MDHTSGSAFENGQNPRSSVLAEEETDLQGGMLYSGAKNSKAALINDVGWGYDCE